MRRVPVLLAFPDRIRADLIERVTAVSVDGTNARIEVMACPYEEDRQLRAARGQRHISPERAWLVPTLTDEQRSALGRAEVVLALDLPLGLTRLAPALAWVQAIGAGTDHLWGTGLGSAPVQVTNAAGVAAVPIAEFVLARLLAVWKRLDELNELQREHRWKPTHGTTVSGRTLGLVGFGAIGTAVAERARAFGMGVLAVRRHPDAGNRSPKGSALADEVHGPEGLHEVLSRSDAVVICAPATPETANLIDADALAAMRPGAILCNVARGTLIDEAALLDAVGRAHVGAAILDVTRDEPLPPDSPLWDTPRVHLSPHSAASVERYMDLLTDLFTANLCRYLGGEPLRNLVEVPADY